MADDAPEQQPKATKRGKEALPFSEDTDALDGRAWNRKPLYVLGVVLAIAVAIALILLGANSLSGGDDDDGGVADGGPVATTTTTAPPTTTTPPTTTPPTTRPPATTAAPTTVPDNACSPEEGQPDCVDPDGDGDYEIIVGGGSCLATVTNPRDCIDTDNDGAAGPPARDD